MTKQETINGQNIIEYILTTELLDKVEIPVEIADAIKKIPVLNNIFDTIDYIRNSILNNYLDLTYHQVYVRGVTTVYLNKAVEDTYIEYGWQPIIYFPEGTIYLKPREKRTPKFENILVKEKLAKKMDHILYKQQAILPELLVGSIVANFFPKPELFSQELLENCLKVAASRAGRREAKDVTASNAYKYHNLKALSAESDDLELIQKGYNTFNRLKKSVLEEYHHKLVFSADQISKEKWYLDNKRWWEKLI